MKIFRLWWQILLSFGLEGVEMTILNRQTRLNANLITCIIVFCLLHLLSFFDSAFWVHEVSRDAQREPCTTKNGLLYRHI